MCENLLHSFSILWLALLADMLEQLYDLIISLLEHVVNKITAADTRNEFLNCEITPSKGGNEFIIHRKTACSTN